VADEITLTLPRERGFERVAHLVLGGLAARLNLTVENLEDLQLALDALLERDGTAGDLTVRMSVHDDALETRVGPLPQHVLDDLDHDASKSELDLRRVLESTVDDVLVDGEWVWLTKKVATVG
jgi:hypothetical protein